MTLTQIIELSRQLNITVYRNCRYSIVPSVPIPSDPLVDFATAIEAAVREECARIVEQDLYTVGNTGYIQQYNDGIRKLAEKIRKAV